MGSKAGQLELPLRHRHVQAVGRAHLALDGKLVAYIIKRSVRRTAISIVVDEEGLRVGAPWDATPNAIERLLQKHGNWVLRKLDEWELKRAPARRWVDGEPLMLMGKSIRLRVVAGAAAICAAGSDLLVAAEAPPSPPVSRQVLEWLHGQALACFRDRAEHFRRALAIERTPHVYLSSARTRWGSCHSSGRIHLNWRLVQMPLRLIDYVVAHEVAHLQEMNHSPRFWRLVARLVPDYTARRDEIRREGHRYLLV